nr:hypothetical protein CFP56_42365 [Quercus suber]
MSTGRLQPIQSSGVTWELTERRARRFHVGYGAKFVDYWVLARSETEVGFVYLPSSTRKVSPSPFIDQWRD